MYCGAVAQRPPSKIHTVTRAYLAGWAPPPARLLRPVAVKFGPQKPKTPAAVGWMREWWGSDSALNAAAEQACSRLEGLMPPLLRDFERHWPVEDDNVRALMAQFVALHAIRTDAAKHGIELAREESLARLEATWESRETTVPFDRFASHARSDGMRVARMLSMINKLASIFASMHWTLLRFEEPWLITSDHPVSGVPLLGPGERADVRGVPVGGWINLIEFRFPISPRLVLLGSWHPGDEFSTPTPAQWSDAANINGPIRGQASRQWFHVPEVSPPLPPMIYTDANESAQFEPLTPRLIDGYGSEAALHSPRRRGVQSQLGRLIEENEDGTMFVARPQYVPAA